MVAPLWVKPAVLPENVGQSSPIFLGDATPKKTLTIQKFVAIVEKMPDISTIKNLCYPKKWTKVHQIFL